MRRIEVFDCFPDESVAFDFFADSDQFIQFPELALVLSDAPSASIVAPREAGVPPAKIVDEMNDYMGRPPLDARSENCPGLAIGDRVRVRVTINIFCCV